MGIKRIATGVAEKGENTIIKVWTSAAPSEDNKVVERTDGEQKGGEFDEKLADPNPAPVLMTFLIIFIHC